MPNTLSKIFPLKLNRVHEAYGDGAASFVAILAAATRSDLIWVTHPGAEKPVNPGGLSGYIDPGKLLLARAARQDEALAVAEESLRHGLGGLVVVETPAALSLTAGRRLQLAAEEGKSRGICLIKEGTGSNAAETRWHCRARFVEGAASEQQTADWTLEKNKSGPTCSWLVRWDQDAGRLIEIAR